MVSNMVRVQRPQNQIFFLPQTPTVTQAGVTAVKSAPWGLLFNGTETTGHFKSTP